MGPIFFCHITKTGGQSIEAAIKEKFKTYQFEHDTDYTKIPDGYGAYVGQVGWYVSELLPLNSFTFTVVRNPVERLLSFYDFYQYHGLPSVTFNGEWLKIQRWPIPPKATPEEFFSHPAIRTVAWNRMTRDLGSQRCILEHSNFQTLRNAKQNVYDMSFCGIFEEFDKSLNYISKLIDADLPIYHVNSIKRNKTRFDTLNSRERMLVEDFTSMDKELYEYAKANYYETIGSSATG